MAATSCVSSAPADNLTIVYMNDAVPTAGPNPNEVGYSQWRGGMYYGQTTPHSMPTIFWNGEQCRLDTEAYTFNNGSGNRIGYRYIWVRPDGSHFLEREFNWGFYRSDGQPHASDWFAHNGNPGAQMSQYCEGDCNGANTIGSGVFSGCTGELFGAWPAIADPYMRVAARSDTGGSVVLIIGTEEDVDAWGPGDFNGSGSVSVQDIFDFVSHYLAGDRAADCDMDGHLAVQDIFDFFAAYFGG